MTVTAAPRPRLRRQAGSGVVFGVATAIAGHVGVPVKWVRTGFVLLATASGLGLALYAVFFVVLPVDQLPTRPRVARVLENVVAAGLAVAVVAIAASSLPQGGLLVPVILACLGAALIWRQASDVDRTRLRVLSRMSLLAGANDRTGQLRLIAGAGLVVAGGALVLRQADVTALRDGAIAVVVALVGVALVTGPWWMRLVMQLSAEREERVRSQERADIAAQLHDSVLQTLALIQRNASSPREVTRLARGQERDLRGVLYGADAEQGQFGDRLRAVAAEVEDAYGIPVEVVIVGTAELDVRLTAIAAAAREALANAARHSGTTSVSLYAEIEPHAVNVFVKDRGSGFDLAQIGDDRQGVRGSIIGRVERHGGTVQLRTSPGSGTEVVITLPSMAAEQP